MAKTLVKRLEQESVVGLPSRFRTGLPRYVKKVGKKAGKFGMASDPFMLEIVKAISITDGKLLEAHVENCWQKKAELEKTIVRLAHEEGRAADFPPPPKLEELTKANFVAHSGAGTGSDSLVNATANRQMRIQMQNQLELIQKMETAYEAYLTRMKNLQTEKVKLEREYMAGPALCYIKLTQNHNLAGFLWSRYCEGFEIGRSRIRRPRKIFGFKFALEMRQARYEARLSVPRPQNAIDLEELNEFHCGESCGAVSAVSQLSVGKEI